MQLPPECSSLHSSVCSAVCFVYVGENLSLRDPIGYVAPVPYISTVSNRSTIILASRSSR